MVEGINIQQTDGYLIARVFELSGELKAILRERFTAICRGEQNSCLNRGNYTYKRTVEEFLKRIESKCQKTQTGMLGELIVHVLTGIEHPNYKTIVPYFNLEERSIKKGFDSVIYSPDGGIWVYEVKSSKHQGSKLNIDSKTKALIKDAHDDLSGKLGKQDKTTRIWDNAMNGLQVAWGHRGDEKKTFEKIFLDYQDKAYTEECSPNRYNVILSSVLITASDTEIGKNCVLEKLREYRDRYKKLMIFAVHKSVTVDLIDFFKEEAADEAS